MSTSIKLSVISPYSGDPTFLHFLKSFQQQTLAPDLFEVIVVSDGKSVSNELAASHLNDFNILAISAAVPPTFHGHTAGLSRNCGANIARGNLLVFLDSDCILHPECLRAHLRAYELSPDMAFCGQALELPAYNRGLLLEQSYPTFEELAQASLQDHRTKSFNSEAPTTKMGWDLWYTCNASVSKKRFLDCGGFNKLGFRCHDQELAYRLFKRGTKFTFLTDAEVIHVEHPRTLRSRQEHINGWLHLAESHPELRAFADARVMLTRKFMSRVEKSCEIEFVRLTRSWKGIRAGVSWVFPPGTKEESVKQRLPYLVFERSQTEGCVRYNLRLHRRCWDYTLIFPNERVLECPVFTVVLPAFNAEKWIARALASILQQTCQSFEIVVVDDGSSDHTVAKCCAFTDDPRIRIVSLAQNGGLSRALNYGLELARGEFLVQLDVDDWLESDALAVILNVFRSDVQIGAVYGDPVIHSESKQATTGFNGWEVSSAVGFFQYNRVRGPRAFRKASLLDVKGWSTADAREGRFYSDKRIFATISDRHKVSWMPQKLYHYHERPDSLSRESPEKTASAKLAILWHEANRRRLFLSYRFSGQYLSAEFSPRYKINIHRSWSVIIPFHRSVEQLEFTIKSWLESDLRFGAHEILVVDDASGHSLDNIVNLAPNIIRIVQSPVRRGAAWARNAGASVAKGEMLFFCDADHIVPMDVISCHERRHEPGDDGIVIGDVFGRRTFTVLEQGCRSRHKDRLLEILRFDPCFEAIAGKIASRRKVCVMPRSQGNIWDHCHNLSIVEPWRMQWGEIILAFGEKLEGFPHSWAALCSANMSICARTFGTLGGFDDKLLSMEDWELGIRAQKQGLRILLAPDAEPYHQIHPVDQDRRGCDPEALSTLLRRHESFITNLQSSWGVMRPPAATFLEDIKARVGEGQMCDALATCSDARNMCAITFDGGPHPLTTSIMLDVLGRFGFHGTFFLSAANVIKYQDVCKRLIAEGHEVAIQGWNQTVWDSLTMTELFACLSRSIEVIEKTTGILPRFIYPPHGSINGLMFDLVSQLGITAVHCDIIANSSRDVVKNDIIRKLAIQPLEGNILLFREATGDPMITASALEWFLNTCSETSAQCVSLDQMFKTRNNGF